MAKITLPPINAGIASQATLNTNFSSVEDALNDNVLYRDNPTGSPNAMQQALDMNSNDINNIDYIHTQGITLNGVALTHASTLVTDEIILVPIVADMKLLSPPANSTIQTKGYYTAGDGGGATYLIKTAAAFGGTPDGYGDHSLANGNVAVLQHDGSVNVKQFGAKGDGVTDSHAALLALWEHCQPNGFNIYFPSGTFLVVDENFPFRNTQLPVTSLLDCNNLTVYGDGASSILKTSTVTGGDVLQTNGLKNYHIRNLHLKSVISGTSAGSNGISITGGFDNITVDRVWATNLAYVDKGIYVDGGGALSIQSPEDTDPITLGSFKATNIFAEGCAYGFQYSCDHDLNLTHPISVDVDVVASNCQYGMVYSAAAATATTLSKLITKSAIKIVLMA